MGASLYNKIPVGHRASVFGITPAQFAAVVGVVAAVAGLAATIVVLLK